MGKTIEIDSNLLLTYFFHDDVKDRREVGNNEKILPTLKELCRIGENIFIQEKSFDGVPFKNYVVAWRRHDWEVEYQRYLSQKWESERYRQGREAEDIQVIKIATMLVAKGLGTIATDTAQKIYDGKNIQLATLLDIDVSDIKWREEVAKDVQMALPELKKAGIF